MKFFLRSCCALCALFLLGMIYWSHLVIEERLLQLQERVEALSLESKQLIQRAAPSLLPSLRPFIDPSLPNLLEEDPFITTTLPARLGAAFLPRGVVHMAFFGHPEHLHPFNHFHDVSNLHNLCVARVAELHVGQYEKFSPSLALKIEQRTVMGKAKETLRNAEPNTEEPSTEIEYWIHLREDAFWEPLDKKNYNTPLAAHFLKRHPVTAHDFHLYYAAVMNPFISEPKAAALRSYLSDITHFEVKDPLTFVVRWKTGGTPPKAKFNAYSLTAALTPLPCFVYQYFPDGTPIIEEQKIEAYRTSSIWAQNFTNHFAKNTIPSCGPWRFKEMTEERIYLERNPNFFSPYYALAEAIDYRFEASFDTLFQDFKAGKLDLCHIPPTQIQQLDNFLACGLYQTQSKSHGWTIHTMDFVDSAYNYIGWNQRTPLFSDRNVRLALTLAINRKRLIAQNLADRAVLCTGPFHCYSPAYDAKIAPWPYNPDKAQLLLHEAGWIDADGDGVREKQIDGKSHPLTFNLVYYSKNQVAKSITEFVAAELKKVGANCQPVGLEITDLSASFDDKKFDALLLGWSMGTPPEDPKQLWHSSLANEKGSSNAIGFQNAEVDALIDALHYEYDGTARQALYYKFHKLIHETVPYTFLYFPKARLAYRERVQNLFIPRERTDLIPDAVSYEPDVRFIWIEESPDKAPTKEAINKIDP